MDEKTSGTASLDEVERAGEPVTRYPQHEHFGTVETLGDLLEPVLPAGEWEAEEKVGRDPSALPLNEAQREDLDRRLDELEKEGPIGLSWEEAVEQIRSRARR